MRASAAPSADDDPRAHRRRRRRARAALPAAVRLIAVSKTFPIEAVRAAYDAGQRDFGENRVQEALQKIAAAPTWTSAGI